MTSPVQALSNLTRSMIRSASSPALGSCRTTYRPAFATLKPQQDHAASVLQADDSRQRFVELSQTMPVQANRLDAQPCRTRCLQQLGNRQLLVDQVVVVDEL